MTIVTEYPEYVENEADTMWVRRDLAADPAGVIAWLNEKLRIGLEPDDARDVREVRMRHYAPDDPDAPDEAHSDPCRDYYHVEPDGPVAYWELRS